MAASTAGILRNALGALLGAALATACTAGGAELPAAGPPQSALPALPDDGPAFSHAVSVVGSLPGSPAFLDSGAPGASPHATQAAWLTLDAAQSGGFAWAVWQIPLAADIQLQQLDLNLQASGLNRYWLAVADYTAGSWRFLLTGQYPAGIQGSQSLSWPGAGLPLEPALHSPGEFAYVACLVTGTNKVNIASLGITNSDPGPGPGDDPIYDLYEDNDTLDSCHPLGPGQTHASVHMSINTEMHDPNEWRDTYDCYCVNVPSGKTLTATLRFEPYDHFWDGVSYRYENDLDLLFYMPGASSILNDFVEQYSSLRIWYYQFEQVTYKANATADYPLCVMGALGEGVPSNAEYDLNIFVSDNAYTVSGYLTQQGALPTKKFVAYLEPGNFSDLTAFGDEGEQDGHFAITGVPDGSYTLKIASSFAFYPAPYTWPETAAVLVSGADSVGNDLDIGADPPT